MKFTNAYSATFVDEAIQWDFLLLPEVSDIFEFNSRWYFRSTMDAARIQTYTKTLTLVADEVFAEASTEHLRPKRQPLRGVNSMSVVPDAIQLAQQYGAKLPEPRR